MGSTTRGYAGHTSEWEKRKRRGKSDRQRVRVSKSTSKALSSGDLSDWDDEELARGQKRSKDGSFRGRPPAIVPKVLHDELVRRTLENAQNILVDNIQDACTALTEIVKDPDANDSDRLKAIDMIMNRVMGKAPEKVEITAEIKPWEQALESGILRDVDPDKEVIDVTPEDDDDWEEAS